MLSRSRNETEGKTNDSGPSANCIGGWTVSDVLVGKCDNCGVNLWESDGYFENDNMCEECFREWDGLTTEEITEALEQSEASLGEQR